MRPLVVAVMIRSFAPSVRAPGAPRPWSGCDPTLARVPSSADCGTSSWTPSSAPARPSPTQPPGWPCPGGLTVPQGAKRAWTAEHAPSRTKRLFQEYLDAGDPSEIPPAWLDTAIQGADVPGIEQASLNQAQQKAFGRHRRSILGASRATRRVSSRHRLQQTPSHQPSHRDCPCLG